MKEALIVLDAQKIYTDTESEMYCEGADTTIDNINKLIMLMESDGQPIIMVRHIHKVDGSDLGRLFDFDGEPEDDFTFKEGEVEVEYDDKLILPQESIEIVKNRYSAFAGTKLGDILNKNKVAKVIVCGFMTNFCCESTARDALDQDFYVDFILDATGTPGTEEYDQSKTKEVVSELLGAGFARMLSTKQYLDEKKKG